jgi:hypothetical protein
MDETWLLEAYHFGMFKGDASAFVLAELVNAARWRRCRVVVEALQTIGAPRNARLGLATSGILRVCIVVWFDEREKINQATC